MPECDEDFSLRPATPDDCAPLYEIHRAAMRSYVAATWGWNEEDQGRRFQSYFSAEPLHLIVVGGEIAGFLHVERGSDAIDVVNIELHPRYQGMGVGSRILRGILDEGVASNRPVMLQVLKVNEDARRLYRRLGFRDNGETSTHYRLRRDP
ncbi:MAG: GNAT family N-acetyltransferase [Thermomicrobiales bacterium]